MISVIVKQVQMLISDDAWRSVHDRRRAHTGNLNSRNAVTIIFAGGLLILLLAALSIKAVTAQDWQALVSGRDGFQLLDPDRFTLAGVAPKRIDCASSCGTFSGPSITDAAHKIKSPDHLNDIAISRDVLPTSSSDRYWARLDYTIPAAAFDLIKSGRESTVVSLHRISYQIAAVTVNGQPWGTFSDNRMLRVILPSSIVSDGDVKIQVTYSIQNNGVTYLQRGDFIPPFLSSTDELRRIEAFEVAGVENNGAMVGLMSRILIGVFTLMLFLFIDGAPESLGLSLLLGFEAVALGLSVGWVSNHWNSFVIHYCWQMGDIFRLYYFMQLARVLKPRPVQWLLWGTALSIPYGIAKQMEVAWGIDGLAVIPRFRDIVAGSIGALACVRTLWSIRGMNLSWRRVALVLGALGSAQQVLGPLTHYWPELNSSDGFRGFFIVFEAVSVYILALSAFTNISTLENRVKNLSEAKARSDVIEQELELGRTVQSAFLNIPKLPVEFDVDGSHEAAVFVSGDLQFVHWNEAEKRLVILISDVTGHGVQAALKATACYMVARNLWQTENVTSGRWRGEEPSSTKNISAKLRQYHEASTEILGLFSELPDLVAFAGVEIFPEARRAFFYRTNFHTPLIIEPLDVNKWDVKFPALKTGEVLNYDLRPGTVIAIFSDGFVDGTRQLSRLKKHIHERMSVFDGTASSLKAMYTEFNDQNENRPKDDRTLVVVSWRRDEFLASVRRSA
jgi:Stage II sporulation protein E (SpoIIE)